ncbi:MAG: fumarylacetoacetate hydrolase family protein [Bdellovibrionales bacterium]
MKLGSLKPPVIASNKNSRVNLDGDPVLVSRDNTKALGIYNIVPSVREAVENWAALKPDLEKLYRELNEGRPAGTISVDEKQFHSPFPRSFQWVDGSAFIQHVKLVRKARNAAPPEDLLTNPLMYQGGSDSFLAPYEDIPMVDFSHGVDFEGEVCVVTDYVPMGTTPEQALKHIVLVMIANDVSLRGLIPAELAKGFGFLQSKPSSAFAPFAVTPDELGDAWKNGRLHLPLHSEYNGQWFGDPDAGEMHFHFGELIAHVAKTRDLGPGSIIGSGTVSNEDIKRGSSCLAEKRMLEQINEGKITTPFMKNGDTIKFEMIDKKGQNVFGTIFQAVKQK